MSLTFAVFAAVVTASTPHLSVRAVAPDTEIASGSTVSITVHVTPKAHMHVYAPGGKYRPVAIKFDTQTSIDVHDVMYPKPETYFFKPLNEEALVYSQPFDLHVDVTVNATSKVKLKGVLAYQACDDRICYLPTSIPLAWDLKVTRSRSSQK